MGLREMVDRVRVVYRIQLELRPFEVQRSRCRFGVEEFNEGASNNVGFYDAVNTAFLIRSTNVAEHLTSCFNGDSCSLFKALFPHRHQQTAVWESIAASLSPERFTPGLHKTKRG